MRRNGGSAENRLYAAGIAVKGQYPDIPAGYKRLPWVIEAHGDLSRPAVDLIWCIPTLAERIVPRCAGTTGTSSTMASASTDNVAAPVQKTRIKNELKQARYSTDNSSLELPCSVAVSVEFANFFYSSGEVRELLDFNSSR
jgi:hypothetical protein